MRKLLSVTMVTVLVSASAGCQCCQSIMRFEAWKNQQLFGIPAYDPCCTPQYCPQDACQGDPCAQNACDSYTTGSDVIYQPQGVLPPATYTPSPTYTTPSVTPGPETYAPSL